MLWLTSASVRHFLNSTWVTFVDYAIVINSAVRSAFKSSIKTYYDSYYDSYYYSYYVDYYVDYTDYSILC